MGSQWVKRKVMPQGDGLENTRYTWRTRSNNDYHINSFGGLDFSQWISWRVFKPSKITCYAFRGWSYFTYLFFQTPPRQVNENYEHDGDIILISGSFSSSGRGSDPRATIFYEIIHIHLFRWIIGGSRLIEIEETAQWEKYRLFNFSYFPSKHRAEAAL